MKRTSVLASMLALTPVSNVFAQVFTPIDLGTLGSASSAAPFSMGMDINNSHVVVGQSTNSTPSSSLAVVWSSITGMVSLPNGGGSTGLFHLSSANAINSSGIIAGTGTWNSGPNTFSSSAYRFNGSTITVLGSLSPLLDSTATGINSAGDIVGYCSRWNSNTSLAFLYRNSTMSLVPMGEAHDINDNGLVVGHGNTSLINGAWTARTWDTVSGTLTQMGTLGGALSRAYGVNNAGQVVGWSSTGTGAWHAYVWTATGGMIDLTPSLSLVDTFAWDINNLGVIVGSTQSSAGTRAFVWQNGVATDLNSFLPSNSGWVLERANAINDQNCITGWGMYNGERHAFVMCIPSPNAVVPLIGAAAFGCIRRRQK